MFNVLLYQPLLNFLVFLYNLIPGHDIGVTIIVLTIIIRIFLYPLTRKSLESQKALQTIQPKMEALKKEYANDKEKLAKEMMSLYSKNKVNPFSSCLPILIQLPFFIAVYQVFQTGLSNGSLDLLYSFIAHPGIIDPVSFGLFDLSKPIPLLALVAGASQYVQSKMMFAKKQPKVKGAEDENTVEMVNKQMMIMMPFLTVIIGLSLPGGLTLYWIITTLLMIFQQYMLKKEKDGDKENDQDERSSQEPKVIDITETVTK